PPPAGCGVLPGRGGADRATGEGRVWLETMSELPVRATGSYLGHGFEPQFAMNIALATLVLGREKLFPPAATSGVERGYEGPLDQVVVTAVGHWRGEGTALIEAVRGRRHDMTATRGKNGRPVGVVDGTGIITSVGAGKAENWARLTAGESGIRRITRFANEGLKTTIAGTVDFVPVEPFCSVELGERMAAMVAEEALADA